MAEIKQLSRAEGVAVSAPDDALLTILEPDGTVPAEAVNVAYLTTLGIGGNNNTDTVDPGVTNDNTESYVIGSRWINTSSNQVFFAVDVSTGAAIWNEMIDQLTDQSIAGIKTFSNGTSSTNSTTGSVVVTGGVGISENLNVGGNLTVSGTTTQVDTTNLNVKDTNILINDGGNDASSEGAGLTVERTGTDGSLVYEDALASKFKLGALASEVEVVDISTAQTLTTKSIDSDNNSITNLVNADIKAAAAIAVNKLAVVTANRAVATDGSGFLVGSTTTNTELGFVNGVSSAIQTQIDSKLDDVITTTGDIIMENTGEQRLAIGSEGEVLTTISGLPSWVAPGTSVKTDNLITNGDFDTTNWQRGTSFDGGAVTQFADRWVASATATGVAVDRQDFVVGQTDVPGEPRHFLKYNQGSVAGDLGQHVHDVRTTAGRTYTVVINARASANTTLTFSATQKFGSGGSGDVLVTSDTYDLTTTAQEFPFTFTCPSISTKTIGTGDDSSLHVLLFTDGGTGVKDFEFSHIMMNEGSVAAPFKPFGGSKAADYTECLRWFRKSYAYYVDPATATTTGQEQWECNGFTSSTYTLKLMTSYKHMPMANRTTPIIILYNSAGTAGQVNVASGSVAGTVSINFTTGFLVSAVDGVAGTTRKLSYQWTSNVEF